MSAHLHHLPPALLVRACDPRPLAEVTLTDTRDFYASLSAELDLDTGELRLCHTTDDREDDAAPTHDMIWVPVLASADRAKVVRWLRETADALEGV